MKNLWFYLAFFLVLLLSSSSLAQSFTLTLDSGTNPITDKLIYVGNGVYELRIHNAELPDNWGWTKTPSRSWGWSTGSPIAFTKLEVDCPGHTYLFGGIYGAKEPSPGYFIIADKTTYPIPAYRNGSIYTNEGVNRIFPGDTLYCRFPSQYDPWEVSTLMKVTPEQLALANKIMGWNEARIAQWPFLQRMIGLYKYDTSSTNLYATPGNRNMGWLLVPANFARRWYNLPIAPIANWYGFGHRSAVGGEGLTNEHYGNEAAWMGSGIRNRDPVAFTVGLYLLRYKIAYGLIDCKDPNNWMQGKWRNEKGNEARGSSGMAPSPAKEWDKGLAMASVLFPNDTFIQRAATIRKQRLLKPEWAWTGSGGARNLGHYLENLRHWYIATGEMAYADRAKAEILHAMSIVGSDPYIRDNVGSVSGGEGLCALAALRWWVFKANVCTHFKGRLDQILTWYITNLLDAGGGATVTYSVVSGPTVISKTFGSPMPGTNWLQIPGLDSVVAYKIAAAAFNKYVNNLDCDAAFGGEGPGWEKFVPWIVNYGGCDL